jgi:hypothetical protein
MKISHGLAEAMQHDKSGKNPYVRVSPTAQSNMKRSDIVKDKLKYKYSQSSVQTRVTPTVEIEGSTRGQAEQLKTFMLDQMLSESGQVRSSPTSNPYAQRTSPS